MSGALRRTCLRADSDKTLAGPPPGDRNLATHQRAGSLPISSPADPNGALNGVSSKR